MEDETERKDQMEYPTDTGVFTERLIKTCMISGTAESITGGNGTVLPVSRKVLHINGNHIWC